MNDVFSLTHNKALLYIIVFTFPFLLHSQSFGVKSINTISTTNDPRDAFIADLDGDGDQDVIAAIFQWNDIIWYKNDGNQNFTSNTTIDTNFKYVNEVVVADFNDDGDMDIVGVGQGSPWDIAYYDNNGSESFTKTVIDNLEAATFIVSLDMEGDGDLDIVVTARNSGKMVWYANDGNSNFGTANEIITGLSYIMSPRYADVDNDGDLDLFVSDAGAWNSGCSCRTGNRETFLFLNDGSASFTQSTIDDGNALYLLDIADIDGDGFDDMLNTSYTEDKVSWMRNKGDNTFEDDIIVTSSLDNAGSARAVDLDNDGDIDFIVTGGTEELVLFENDGNQNFTERTLATSFGSQGLRTGDIDGDGDLDVIAGSRSNDYIKWIELDSGPSNISLTSNTISETSSIGSLVGTLSATDSDTSSTFFTFSFASGNGTNDADNGSFTISGTSLLTSTTLDYETKDSYTIYINVNDGTTDFAKAFTVSVTNVNEAPTDLSFEETDVNVEYLIVAGGGGGGYRHGAGGGAGGLLTGTFSVFASKTFDVTVGQGGAGGNGSTYYGSNGDNSELLADGITTLTAIGGGGARSNDTPSGMATEPGTGSDGGSGSGAAYRNGVNVIGGSGTPGQGHNGGNIISSSLNFRYNHAGGGGAGGVGGDGTSTRRGDGGIGIESTITGTSKYYAGGGGGGTHKPSPSGGGAGGLGGGGAGGTAGQNSRGVSGTPNTGGGGGGASTNTGGNSSGGAGGSGIVILRYLGTPKATGGTITQSGGYTIHSFTNVGTNNFTITVGGTVTTAANVDEGSAVGTVVATLTATDSDTTNLTYSLATGNGTTDQHNSLFTVSGTQLLVASSTISYDTTSSLNVNLQVSDGEYVISKAFQITVNDVNRAPTDIGLSSNTITENASPSTVVGILSSVDSDTTDTTSFTLATSGDAQDDDNGSFTISGTSLILNSSPDYETKAGYNIYINVNDGTNDFAKSLTVSVTDLLELSATAPISNQNTVTLDTDIAVTFDSPVKTSTVNASNIVITGKNTGIISGTFSGGGTTTVGFNPTNDFKPGEVITVTLTSGLQNTSGGALTVPQTFSFTTRNAATVSPTFTAADIATSADGAFSVFAADMDGDGDMDILSASYDDNTIAWYENDGNADPSFTASNITTSANRAYSVYAADMDRDGDMDILSASRNDNTIAWYENDGNTDPTFAAADITTSADGATSVYAADMDGDGDMDIISASYDDDTIAWYENDGNDDPSFTATDIATSANGALSVYAADMDGDGDMDIISASYDDNTIAWYENDGNANPTFTAADIATSANQANTVYAADMDGDGDLDILSASFLDDTIAWYENDGNANPSFTATDITTSADGARSVYAADVDGDGDMDVLSASLNDDTIAWYENDGNADPSFTASTIATSADYARSVYAADIDGDGDMDILSASQNDDTIAWYETAPALTFTSSTPATSSNTVALDADITLTFNLAVKTSTVNASNIVITGKNTGIISGTFSGGGTMTVGFNPTNDFKPGEVITVTLTSGLQNTSGGALTVPHTFSFTTQNATTVSPTFTVADIATSADGAHSVFAADIDGDGDLDIVSASYLDNTIAWYENDGSAEPSFTAVNIATSANSARSVYVADMDGDGDLDIVSASLNDNTIAWYENDGNTDPSFTATDIATSADGAHSVYVADMDGDGDLDILSASQNDDTIAWYENDGNADPSFTAANIATSADGARAVFAADIDGDGDVDILSASYVDNTIAWYKNDGNTDPGFTAINITTSANGAVSVYAADIDGDGDLDILSASEYDDTIAWFENDGNADPSFTAINITTFADGARAVYAADMDGDGDLDIISASEGDDTIAWYENDGNTDPSFTAADIATSADGARAVFVADMDGDGDMDILSASRFDDTIAWYEVQSSNTAPTDIILSTSSVDENTPLATTVGVFTTTDSDTLDTHTYSLVSGIGDTDNGSFTVSGTSLFTATTLDYETKSSYSIRIRTSDGTATYSKTFTISVIDVDEDPDNDGITGINDNCPTTANADQADSDGDGVGDVCDNCKDTANASQLDTDGDGIGNDCDDDDDNDGVPDSQDAFPLDASESLDSDADGIGDELDPDADNDGVADENDNCITVANTNQADMDGDGIGDVCDTDTDGDGYSNVDETSCDSDPLNSSSTPSDLDGDFVPDCIDTDKDGDGYENTDDLFPLDKSEWIDSDNDGIGDNTDTDDDNDGWLDTLEETCETDPKDSSDAPIDTDQDGDPDCIDTDDDNDTYLDTNDTFPLNAEEWSDNDLDGIGDNADPDDDNDEYLDTDEIACESDPLDSSSLPLDFDGDLSPDCVDTDDDNDDCLDVDDDYPLDPSYCKDTDGDGIDDEFDFDSDNDGVPDDRDAFPLDPNGSVDSDGDGIPDSQDDDDNNDGFPDQGTIISTVITPNQPGVESTWKIINLEDYPFTSVKVYAPDGSIVFESMNYQNDWNGNNIRTGTPLPTGPYYYRISLGGTSDEVKEGWLYIFN